jgi:hypothetical protein
MPSPSSSPLTVQINTPAAATSFRPLVLAVFSFRHDAHLVPALLRNLEPIVDGWVSYDDRSSLTPFTDECARRKALLEAAVASGATWILAADPAERFEDSLSSRIRELTAAEGLVAYGFPIKAMYSPIDYRIDQGWNTLKARRLFSIRPGFAYDRHLFQDHWYPSDAAYRILTANLNIYNFRSATAARRERWRQICVHLDPLIEHRPLAYEYLTDEDGMRLTRIPSDRPYSPAFLEDGGLWMAAPPAPRRSSAEIRAGYQASFDRLRRDPGSPRFATPLPGRRRGVDAIDRQTADKLLASEINRFAGLHGYAPDLFAPKRFLEKLVWRKFFASLEVPRSGNKLLVHTYIPPHLSGEVRPARVVWRSATPALPDDGALAEGWYWLKSNHGTRRVERIRWPLGGDERARLQKLAADWLRPFEPRNFEWWYNAFPPELFLEENIEGKAAACTWSYPAFPDGVPYVNVNQKVPGGVRAIRLSPSLEPLREAYQPRYYQRLESWVAPVDPRRVAAIAVDIARPLGFARIDFLFAADGSCILNEVTLTPNNAGAYLHPDLDIRLGELWKTLS